MGNVNLQQNVNLEFKRGAKMTLNEILIESLVYSVIGTVTIVISLLYILYRQDKGNKDDK